MKGDKILFWILTIGLFILAVTFCTVGRGVRHYAYHAGHGFGLGAANVPRLFWSIPWPIVWVLGGVFTVVSTVFVVLAIGIGREIRFIILMAIVLGLGHFLGNLVFYRLFKKDMESAYRRLDKFESEVQTGIDELKKIERH